MKPISGDAVLSIIHGPATTGHFVEMSKFLNQEIDVLAKNRAMIFGGGSSSRQPHSRRLNVGHRSSAGRAGGHFTLHGGLEPRNPDAGCHPDNCGFDVVSDQTGYPASLLRRVIVQRMLVRLYQSRLRGRDHRFQCSRCGISGGVVYDLESAHELLTKSREIGPTAHFHLHLLKPAPICQCGRYFRDIHNNRCIDICCLWGYTWKDVYLFVKDKAVKSGFQQYNQMLTVFVAMMNSQKGQLIEKFYAQPDFIYTKHTFSEIMIPLHIQCVKVDTEAPNPISEFPIIWARVTLDVGLQYHNLGQKFVVTIYPGNGEMLDDRQDVHYYQSRRFINNPVYH